MNSWPLAIQTKKRADGHGMGGTCAASPASCASSSRSSGVSPLQGRAAPQEGSVARCTAQRQTLPAQMSGGNICGVRAPPLLLMQLRMHAASCTRACTRPSQLPEHSLQRLQPLPLRRWQHREAPHFAAKLHACRVASKVTCEDQPKGCWAGATACAAAPQCSVCMRRSLPASQPGLPHTAQPGTLGRRRPAHPWCEPASAGCRAAWWQTAAHWTCP